MTDRAPAPADVEAITEVLAAHVLQPVDPACPCGWDWDYREVILPSEVDFDSSRYRLPMTVRPEQHRAHVAAALLASPALATLRAHERTNALRDAADDLNAYDDWSLGIARWLRDRADRQEPQP